MKSSINRNIFAFFTVIIASVLISCASAPSTDSPNQAVIEMRRNVYISALREEGYPSRIEKDGAIKFERKGDSYYLVISDIDPSLVFIFLPEIFNINSPAKLQAAAIAVGNANRSTYVAKSCITGDTRKEYISIGADLFLDDPEDLKIILPRLMNAIDTARTTILDDMK
jgi:hypothetical protein